MRSVLLRSRGVFGALLVTAVCGCASPTDGKPGNVLVGKSASETPHPIVRKNNARPLIQLIKFSSVDVRRGERWWGRIVTSTNVASVEVRSNLFSVDVPRRRFGVFAFNLDVFDLPPIFIRAYRLRVIARNSAGVATEEDVPFRFR